MKRMSAPFSSMCVAHECRSKWHEPTRVTPTAIACAATGLVGKEHEVFRSTIKYSLALLAFVILIGLVEAWVFPWAVPNGGRT